MEKIHIKKYVADLYASSSLTRAQVKQGKVIINGQVYIILNKDSDKPLSDLDVLLENFTLTKFENPK